MLDRRDFLKFTAATGAAAIDGFLYPHVLPADPDHWPVTQSGWRIDGIGLRTTFAESLLGESLPVDLAVSRVAGSHRVAFRMDFSMADVREMLWTEAVAIEIRLNNTIDEMLIDGRSVTQYFPSATSAPRRWR